MDEFIEELAKEENEKWNKLFRRLDQSIALQYQVLEALKKIK